MAIKSPFTPEQEQEALEMFRQGMSTSEVFRSFGAKSLGSLPSYEIERRAIAKTQGRSVFNTQAAQDVFTQAGKDVQLASQQGLGKAALTATIQGGLSVPRAVGEGFFASDVGQAAVSPVIEGMTRFGEAITPQVAQDVIGDLAMQTIEGYETMSPQEKLNQRNKLGVAEVLSYFVGGKAANEAVIAPSVRVGENVAREVGRGIDAITPERTTTRTSTGAIPDKTVQNIVSNFDTAIKPNLASKQTPAQRRSYEQSVSEAVQSISDNIENLRFFDETTGETVQGTAPTNLKQFVDSIEQTKQQLFKEYDALAQQTGETGARIDVARLADELNDVVNNRSLQVSNPGAIEYAQSVQNRLRQVGNLGAGDAQEVIKQFNNSLDAFYRNPTPEGLTRQSVDALIANRLRQVLDEEVQAITGGAYQTLKQRYGALSAIERDVMRAYNRDARRNVRGLIDFTDVFTGGQVVAGLVSMNPAVIAQGLVGKGIAQATKMFNDPNRRVNKIFKEASKFKRDTPTTQPTRQALPAPREGALRSEVSSGAAIEVGGETPTGRVEPGITERIREGAVRKPEGEAQATELERALREDNDAVAQAVSEMEAEMSGDVRTSYGDNFVQTAEGSYRFNELPSWIPDGLRDGALMERVMRNIVERKTPRTNATNELELQRLVEDRMKARIEEIKKGKGDSGIFSGDTAFAAALMAGGTYYMFSEDGQMMPIVAIGSMMSNPIARKAALESAKKVAAKGGKVPAPYKRKIAEALEEYDAGFTDVRENGARKSIAPDKIDQRIGELQEKNFSGIFTDKDALEAEELMANKGVILERDSFNQGATPSTNLLEEAKKYKSAEEFVNEYRKNTFIHGTNKEIKGGLQLKSKALGVAEPESNAVDALFVTPSDEVGIMHSRMYTKQDGKLYSIKLKPEAKIFDYSNPEHRNLLKGKLSDVQQNLIERYLIDGQLYWAATPPPKLIKELGFDGMKAIERKAGEAAFSESFGDAIYSKNAESIAIFNKNAFTEVDTLTDKQLKEIWAKSRK